MPGLVVADIGGSSSRWVWIRDGSEPRMVDGIHGFNPAMGDGADLIVALEETISRAPGMENAGRVIAYGAGCGTAERQGRMAAVLHRIWPSAKIDVHSDLLGAARGMLGSEPGLVLILGTGMNAGYYDGRDLHQPMPSLGYILGDEGSGADIGKHFLMEAFNGGISPALLSVILPQGITMDEVVANLYRGPAPQKWIASFAEPLAHHVDHPQVRAIITARFVCLAGMLEEHFATSQRERITAVGSVAVGLRSLLSEVLAKRGMRLTDVERSPLQGLVRYHQGSGR